MGPLYVYIRVQLYTEVAHGAWVLLCCCTVLKGPLQSTHFILPNIRLQAAGLCSETNNTARRQPLLGIMANYRVPLAACCVPCAYAPRVVIS